MKTSVFAFLLVIAGAFAYPQGVDDARVSRIIKDQTRSIIDQIQEIIQRLDPIEVDRLEYQNEIIPNLLALEAYLEGVSIKGLSNIVIEDLEYVPFVNRLTVRVSLPEISLSIGGCGLNVKFINSVYQGELSGSAAFRGISFFVELSLNLDIFEGIGLRSITLDLNFGTPEVNLSLIVLGADYSETVNGFLQDRVPAYLEQNRNVINRALENIIRIIFEYRFGQLSSY